MAGVEGVARSPDVLDGAVEGAPPLGTLRDGPKLTTLVVALLLVALLLVEDIGRLAGIGLLLV